MKDLKTIKETANIFGVTTQTVRHWLKKGGIHFEYEKVVGIKPRIVINVDHVKRSFEVEKFNKSVDSTGEGLMKAIKELTDVLLDDDRDVKFIKEQIETLVHNYFFNVFGVEDDNDILDSIAKTFYDGHYTIMKFTTNCRFMWGTIDDTKPLREQISNMICGENRKDVIKKAVLGFVADKCDSDKSIEEAAKWIKHI